MTGTTGCRRRRPPPPWWPGVGWGSRMRAPAASGCRAPRGRPARRRRPRKAAALRCAVRALGPDRRLRARASRRAARSRPRSLPRAPPAAGRTARRPPAPARPVPTAHRPSKHRQRSSKERRPATRGARPTARPRRRATAPAADAARPRRCTTARRWAQPRERPRSAPATFHPQSPRPGFPCTYSMHRPQLLRVLHDSGIF